MRFSRSRTERGDGGSGSLLLGALLVALVAAGLFFPWGKKDATPAFEPMSATARPVTLTVPSLHLRSQVLPIKLGSDGVLDPPGDVTKVGWWNGSAWIGDDGGQTVITGHTVHTGGGVMDHLGKLRPGSTVMVATRKGTMSYRATKVLTLSKAAIDRRAVELFGQKRSDNRLVLVTCTGWTGSAYTSNIVVFAEPLGVRQRTA